MGSEENVFLFRLIPDYGYLALRQFRGLKNAGTFRVYIDKPSINDDRSQVVSSGEIDNAIRKSSFGNFNGLLRDLKVII